jgi:hypothetical protein
MTARRFSRVVPAGLALAVALAVAPAPAAAQEHTVIEGTVQSISGQTLTLLSDTFVNEGRPVIGPNLVPIPPARRSYVVDLSQLPTSDYASIQTGERMNVIGALASDGRRLVASLIVRRGGERRDPQAP